MTVEITTALIPKKYAVVKRIHVSRRHTVTRW